MRVSMLGYVGSPGGIRPQQRALTPACAQGRIFSPTIVRNVKMEIMRECPLALPSEFNLD